MRLLALPKSGTPIFSDAAKVVFRLHVIEGYEITRAGPEEGRTSPDAEVNTLF